MKKQILIGTLLLISVQFCFARVPINTDKIPIKATKTYPFYLSQRIIPYQGQAIATSNGGESWVVLSDDKTDQIKLECEQLMNAQPFFGESIQNKSAESEVTVAPFANSSMISFNLPANGNTIISAYSITGIKVAELPMGMLSAGKHTADLNSSNLNSGVYFYRIINNGQQLASGKLMVYH